MEKTFALKLLTDMLLSTERPPIMDQKEKARLIRALDSLYRALNVTRPAKLLTFLSTGVS